MHKPHRTPFFSLLQAPGKLVDVAFGNVIRYLELGIPCDLDGVSRDLIK